MKTKAQVKQMKLTYKQAQAQLKSMRNNGFDVRVKLNATHAVLSTELERLENAVAKPESELAAAHARIRELEAEVEQLLRDKRDMLVHLQARVDAAITNEPEPVANQAEVEQDASLVYETLMVTNDNYTPMYIVAEQLPNLPLARLHAAIYHLQLTERVDLSTLQEASAFTHEQIATGIKQNIGGPIFFIIRK